MFFKEPLPYIVVILLIHVSFYTSNVNAQSHNLFEHGKSLITEARDQIYNFEKDDMRTEQLLEQCNTIFSSLFNKREQYYWTAQVDYLYGLYFLKCSKVKVAEQHFISCSHKLTKSNEELGETSENYSLLAEAYTQLMLSKGLAFQLMNGMKLKHYSDKALKLDSSNVKAYQSLAIYTMNAPAAIGGSIQNSIKLLMRLTCTDKSDLFKLYYLLGNAYMKLRNSEEALKYLHLALTIYPQNRWAIDDIALVHSRTKN
jgi:tetratricopeptide (TPR) repeat protein